MRIVDWPLRIEVKQRYLQMESLKNDNQKVIRLRLIHIESDFIRQQFNIKRASM